MCGQDGNTGGCKHPWPDDPQVIPAQVRRLNNLIFRKVNQFLRASGVDDVTPMHNWIMGYLYIRRDEEVFQRDIERDFSITRSTVTNILQLMEQKGYIVRQSVPQDARLKRIRLTESGEQSHLRMMSALHEADAYVSGLLTAEENTQLMQLLNKLYASLKDSE